MESDTLKTDKSDCSEAFNLDAFSGALKKCMFGKNVIFRDTIGSTNVFLKALAQQGFPEGTVVITDEQSAGLGRLGRQWFSKKGQNLLFSVLLRPRMPPNRLFVLTMILGLAGIDAMLPMSGLSAKIKWPNDIYIGEKKLGGILTEFAVKQGVVEYVVLGMGLNVNWYPPTEHQLLYPTSSIFAEIHKKVSRERLLGNLLKRFEAFYLEALDETNPGKGFYKRWNEKSAILGKSVVIETGNERVEGVAAGIDQDGALGLITAEGHERKFVCGDVSVQLDVSEP